MSKRDNLPDVPPQKRQKVAPPSDGNAGPGDYYNQGPIPQQGHVQVQQGQIQPGQLPIGDPGLSNGNEYGNIVPMGYNQQGTMVQGQMPGHAMNRFPNPMDQRVRQGYTHRTAGGTAVYKNPMYPSQPVMTSAQPTPAQPIIGGGPGFSSQSYPSQHMIAPSMYNQQPQPQRFNQHMRAMHYQRYPSQPGMPHHPGQNMMAMGPGQNMMMNHGHGLSSGGDNSLSSMMGPRAPNAGQVGHNFQMNSNSLNDSESDRKRLIQQQLVLLLHAHKCQSRDPQNGETTPCQLPNCDTMKRVLNHMTHCQLGRACTVMHCASSRQIILHWKSCSRPDCPVCLPLKESNGGPRMRLNQTGPGVGPSLGPGPGPTTRPELPSNQIPSSNFPNSHQDQYNNLGPPVSAPSVEPAQPTPPNSNSMQIAAIQEPQGNSRPWHSQIQQHGRDNLVQKLVAAICPVGDAQAWRDRRMSSLIQYAKKVEKDMYMHANSLNEYYNLLAEKIYKIQKELDEKKQNKIKLRAPTPHNGESSSNNSFDSENGVIRSPNQQHANSPRPNDDRGPPSNASQPSPMPKTPDVKQEIRSPPSVPAPPTPVIKEEPRSVDQKSKVEQSPKPHASPIRIKSEVKTEPGSEDCKDSKALVLPSPKKERPVPKEPRNKKVFTKEELYEQLEPLVKQLMDEPEGAAFRAPVDPIKENIPDYFDVVKKPMDLGTIMTKLDNHGYPEPWKFIDDVHLMLENAFMYNRKNTRIYKNAAKLKEMFESLINAPMKVLGYCCGRTYVFYPLVLYCWGTMTSYCSIARDAEYWDYQNRYHYCNRCFNDQQSDHIQIPDETTRIPKTDFVHKKNDKHIPEEIKECGECGRQNHQLCVLHHDAVHPEGFVCAHCIKETKQTRKEHKYTAQKLPHSKLGKFVEDRVTKFLSDKAEEQSVTIGEVTIRIVSSSDKYTMVKQSFKERYPDTPSQFPYRAKALFAFQKRDGVDVCFFGMHLQEYSSDCQSPNTRRVYISYLDSVHFFKPYSLRTEVYYEILLSYLDYAKQLGYSMAHIWACPPCEGDDYIFHFHPVEQKVPKAKRLQDWYRAMLEVGKKEGIIYNFKNIFTMCIDEQMTSAAEVYYFEGDFWPSQLEEFIKEMDREEAERKALEQVEEDGGSENGETTDAKGRGSKVKGVRPNKTGQKRKNSFKRGAAKKMPVNSGGDELFDKVYSTMDKHKEVFFAIYLHDPDKVDALPPIQDPDPLISCDLMDGRDNFLALAKEKRHEFSSLRRAKFSTLSMLCELHTQGQEKFVYNCNNCSKNVETRPHHSFSRLVSPLHRTPFQPSSSERYHCAECTDFDLCIPCYKKIGHQHNMEKLGLGLELDTPAVKQEGTKNQINQQELRKQSIQRCIQSLVHACRCNDEDCHLPSCTKMKKVVQHTKTCKRKTNGGCPICKQLIALCCFHAKHCSEYKCPVPFCPGIKQRLKQQWNQNRQGKDQLVRRRMMMMRANNPTQTPPPPGPPPAAAAAADAVVKYTTEQPPTPKQPVQYVQRAPLNNKPPYRPPHPQQPQNDHVGKGNPMNPAVNVHPMQYANSTPNMLPGTMMRGGPQMIAQHAMPNSTGQICTRASNPNIRQHPGMPYNSTHRMPASQQIVSHPTPPSNGTAPSPGQNMGPHHGMPGNYNVRPINSGYPPQGYVMHQQQRYPVMYQQVPQNHYPAPINTPPMYSQQGHLVPQPGHVMVQQQPQGLPQQHPNMPPQQQLPFIMRGQAPNVRAHVMAPPKYGAKGTRTKGKASPRMQNSPQAPSPQAPQMSPVSQPPLMEMDTSSPAGAPAPIYPEEDILMPSEQTTAQDRAREDQLTAFVEGL